MNNSKKSKKLIVAGIVVVLLVVGLIAGCANSGDPASTDASKSETSSVNKEPAASKVYKVGDVIKASTLEIKYVDCQDFIEENPFMQPDEGNKYIALKLEFYNTGNFSKYITSSDFTISVNGYDFSGFNLTSVSNPLYLEELASGLKMVRTLVIQVPESATADDIKCVYKYDTFHSYTLAVSTVGE